MSVLCLTVCRLCVSNIMSLGICAKNSTSSKLGAFAWYSVKIRAIFGVQFERRKVDKKQIYTKTETWKLYSRVLWTFKPNFIKIDLIISSYTVSKLVRFLGTLPKFVSSIKATMFRDSTFSKGSLSVNKTPNTFSCTATKFHLYISQGAEFDNVPLTFAMHQSDNKTECNTKYVQGHSRPHTLGSVEDDKRLCILYINVWHISLRKVTESTKIWWFWPNHWLSGNNTVTCSSEIKVIYNV